MAAAPANLDWVFIVAGSALALLGLAAFLWALFWDRARGRRRCNRCWYDLSATPGLTCPECGRTARSERRLRRTRRRWRPAAVALLLCLLAAAIAGYPRYRSGGWPSVVPSTILIYFAPLDPPTPIPFFGAPAAPTPATSLRELLHEEVWKRLDAGAMWSWQTAAYMRRWLRANPAEIARTNFVIPARWPADRPLRIGFRPPSVAIELEARLPGGEWALFKGSAYATLGTPPPGAEVRAIDIRLTRFGHTLHADQLPVSITVAGAADTFLERLDSPAATERLRAALRPRLIHTAGRLALQFDDRSRSPQWAAADFGIVFSVELRQSGRPIARARTFADWLPRESAPTELVYLDPIPPTPANAAAPNARADPTTANAPTPANPATAAAPLDPAALLAGPLELILKGDPAEAGEMYCSQLPGAVPPACWSGELTIPINPTTPTPPPIPATK